MNIGEAFKIVKNAEKSRKRIFEFCREQISKSLNNSNGLGWFSFRDYDINGNNLVIHYDYGFGDFEHTDSIHVDMTPYLRDENLNDILDEKI